MNNLTEQHKQKLQQALAFLGEKYVLHPAYKGGHRYTESEAWKRKKKPKN